MRISPEPDIPANTSTARLEPSAYMDAYAAVRRFGSAAPGRGLTPGSAPNRDKRQGGALPPLDPPECFAPLFARRGINSGRRPGHRCRCRKAPGSAPKPGGNVLGFLSGFGIAAEIMRA